MTSINMMSGGRATVSKLDVWCCESCRCVHMRVGDMLLTFTKSEFHEFAENVVGCYFDGSTPLDKNVFVENEEVIN
jgi:hypothetical protein